MLNALIVALAAALPVEGGAEGVPVEAGSPAPARTTVFRAAKLHLGDGTVLEDGAVVVQNGVITQVGAAKDLPKGADVIEHDGVISPGLIALHSYEGAGGELDDSTREVLPDAEARHAFAPGHSDYRRAREAGITTIVLAPTPDGLVGGQSVVVKTGGGAVIKPSAHLALGLSRRALNSNAFPTSYAGAMQELDRLFTEGEGAFGRALSGALPVLMQVGDRAETMRALAFAKRHRLQGALYGSVWAEDMAEALAESGLAVIATPFDVGDSERQVRSVVALQQKGVRFGFGLDAPARHPESLRFGAALCVRGGLPADAALRALTADAAAIAGVPGRVGRLARGLDADLLFWSGEPTALSSTLEAVYIDGKLVHGGDQ
jgi:imidazolonepropionase-like amidohydrolase